MSPPHRAIFQYDAYSKNFGCPPLVNVWPLDIVTFYGPMVVVDVGCISLIRAVFSRFYFNWSSAPQKNNSGALPGKQKPC